MEIPIKEETLERLYFPQPVNGQWHHYVCAVSGGGEQYGVQCSVFKFGKVKFCHMAVTDVQRKAFIKEEWTIGDRDFWPVVQNTPYRHTVRFGFSFTANYNVDLDFDSEAPRWYDTQTSQHYGFPRMEVKGRIGNAKVKGFGCFDREIFNKLLLPGETGWNWKVAWLKDGSTYMDYRIENRQPVKPEQPLNLTWEPAIPGQAWGKHKGRNFSYIERLCRVSGDKEGMGYEEIVGFDGTPNI